MTEHDSEKNYKAPALVELLFSSVRGRGQTKISMLNEFDNDCLEKIEQVNDI